MATSCPALSSIRSSASLESLQTWFFRTAWRGRKWLLNFLWDRGGSRNNLSEHLSYHMTNLSVKSSRRCSYQAQTIGCDWGRNECHFRYRHEGRVVVGSSHTRIRGHQRWPRKQHFFTGTPKGEMPMRLTNVSFSKVSCRRICSSACCLVYLTTL